MCLQVYHFANDLSYKYTISPISFTDTTILTNLCYDREVESSLAAEEKIKAAVEGDVDEANPETTPSSRRLSCDPDIPQGIFIWEEILNWITSSLGEKRFRNLVSRANPSIFYQSPPLTNS